MNSRKMIMIGSMASLITGIAACGGSGSSSDTTDTTSRLVTGPITAFGSVYVNGNRYNTDHAKVYVEGSEGSESDLRVGMVVSVEASADGKAKSIHFSDDLEGFVISNAVVDDGTGTMTGTMNVMGQDVTIDADTIFESHVDGVTDASLVVKGNIVEVTGYSTGTGQITATRIEVKAASLTDLATGVELKGIVASHLPDDQTFMIGALAVNYADASHTDMPAGSWDGLYVEVKSKGDMNNANQLVAAKVELVNAGSRDHHGVEGDDMEVYGAVSAVTDASVTINGQIFLLNADTKFEHGSRADLVEGVLVKAEGYVNADGDSVAKEIKFNAHADSAINEIEGAVTSIDLTDTNTGTIVVKGQTILIDNSTIMHDSDAANGFMPDMHFNLSKLNMDDFVEVHVVANGDGTFTATRLEREKAPVKVVPAAG